MASNSPSSRNITYQVLDKTQLKNPAQEPAREGVGLLRGHQPPLDRKRKVRHPHTHSDNAHSKKNPWRISTCSGLVHSCICCSMKPNKSGLDKNLAQLSLQPSSYL